MLRNHFTSNEILRDLIFDGDDNLFSLDQSAAQSTKSYDSGIAIEFSKSDEILLEEHLQ